ncbi:MULTISPECIES: OsmC family protein [Acinetobacter]|jgi:Predicted redox protein, regulator of disulfide bond formation|uniref:Peroxiredoxin, subfamily n=1 Tax=Acinetobacter calcoaceticus TaxID=471 RepID=A0A446ZIP3_ACICA|nr:MULTISPECIES: OsmC family protein [Acinetobacter]MCG9494425.1 OsmC family protein [Acinetobacter pittii]MCG9511515.1 OsmC family protein [Acinetobacter pittii]MCU4349339.1 OsmC family protein [Acinetobacter lactucae]MCZ1177619.1 OsmC family protein [Acinetobacter pittii]MDA3452061.1 OsmC family protein [Acinetobacter sp. AOR43_HL]
MNNVVNEIDLNAFQQFADKVSQNPTTSKARFNVQTRWAGQTRSVSTVKSYELFGKTYERNFHIAADEPHEILGTDSAPNPQELLMAALNACLTVAYVAIAATKGVKINSLEIDTSGELDLRGFLGLDEKINPGYDEVQYTVVIDTDGTQEQLDEIHSAVLKTSPNFANFSRSIRMKPQLVIANK